MWTSCAVKDELTYETSKIKNISVLNRYLKGFRHPVVNQVYVSSCINSCGMRLVNSSISSL